MLMATICDTVNNVSMRGRDIALLSDTDSEGDYLACYIEDVDRHTDDRCEFWIHTLSCENIRPML